MKVISDPFPEVLLLELRCSAMRAASSFRELERTGVRAHGDPRPFCPGQPLRSGRGVLRGAGTIKIASRKASSSG